MTITSWSFHGLYDIDIKILFLEASDDVLIKRYKETRKEHPIGKGKSIEESIASERKILANIKEMADVIIDTSELSVRQLHKETLKIRNQEENIENITIPINNIFLKNKICVNYN